MINEKFARFGTSHQTSWDGRAAANFILGGAGSALLAITVLASWPNTPNWPLLALALSLIGAGLASVWTEIGRPWRAFNVLFHPQTSWMTREAFVAGLIALLVVATIVTGMNLAAGAAALAGLLFLYCQGRILRAAKGIPAWREFSIVRLIISTGLVEGLALLMLADLATGTAYANMPAALLVLVVLRFGAWWIYRSRMLASDAPRSTRATLGLVHRALLGGTVLPALAVALAIAVPAIAAPGTAVAALTALAAGWWFKYLLITRAAQVQGYALGNKLRRGHPLANRA
ncbi:MAG: phenylacetyl-CoA:acceptor oxidoreductase [Betaproteobacteria bacterium HGW-Betaproteobacteria-13]|jgi:phenylacetyl-CoA:acceptor oxidoreductase subunit 2|uniref:Phenylacetyl-CoA:acceptor oxidoreductase n=1 Tax=Parazoarcus communis TaxID=41977 RepID=A0A2U8H6L7_9RHOO|nr:DmsC/YnfH family molybdoenzyme membrane anchor subunit [Parazoarcus communis]AWI80816.1 phenylacetyl-CoA:acceptor oxidoreductase [Parazoarcus communis]PKO60302.1 MAG: phenylacetyl-CoA:acceptor oxidoreductase [Betaproteobacteria bacterium HGW-Betaproteobacteria-19]PKO79171.1 MAG: phenylacetyl-CoA:acceptor oxidoreductase [Betaproteobacteria bacterium HGW-Betaproteobacteria-13]